jgi:hypothetical protein
VFIGQGVRGGQPKVYLYRNGFHGDYWMSRETWAR